MKIADFFDLALAIAILYWPMRILMTEPRGEADRPRVVIRGRK